MNHQKNVPRCVRRTRRRLWLCLPITFAVGLLGLLGSRWWPVYVCYYWAAGNVALGLCVFPLMWCVSRRERRLYAKLIRNRYALCPNCLYDLSGKSPDSDRCPECGNVFDPKEWADFVPIWFNPRKQR